MPDIPENVTLDWLARELVAFREEMRAELAQIRPRVDGLPLVGAAIETLQRDMRMLRAAINDMARVNITAGEVEALHTEMDGIQARNVELERRLATLERLVEALEARGQ